MIPKKFDKIIVSIEDKEKQQIGSLAFSVSFDSNVKTYKIVFPDSWNNTPVETIIQLLKGVVCVYALGYRPIAKEVVVNFTITSNEEDLLSRIEYPFFSGLSYATSGHPLIGSPTLGVIKYLNIEEVAPFTKPLKAVSKSPTIAQGFSGGKESMLCYGLLKDTAKISPLYVSNHGDKKPSFKGVEGIEYLHETAYPWDEVFKIIGYDHWYPSISFIRLLYSAIHGVATGSYYIINGNEFNRTEFFQAQSGAYSFGTNFGQSNYAMGMVQHYLYYHGLTHKVFSPCQNMSELLEEVLLFSYFPEYAKIQVSCFQEIESGNTLIPCGSCPKCVRLSALVKGIQFLSSSLGLPKDVGESFMKGFPTEGIKFGSTNAVQEELAISALVKGTITKDVLDVLSLREDILHPFKNIPENFLTVIQEKVDQIRERLPAI